MFAYSALTNDRDPPVAGGDAGITLFFSLAMGLHEYKRKRSFSKTPEPEPSGEGKRIAGKQLQFVIQKHDASRLHYDFRLEIKGVLKSWAVPKGPSLNPADKRLAMLVEDHPFTYKNFEGIIPEGNYGAGTVIIWDQGTYEPVDEVGTRNAQEKQLLKDFDKGSMKIRMYGKKLKGEFALVRLRKENNAWLLIKHRDQHASDADILLQDKSVVSGKTIEEMASDPIATYGRSNRLSANGMVSTSPSGVNKDKQGNIEIKNVLSGVKRKKKSPVPEDIKPMLATLVDKPFDDEGWLYEVKWDGFRAISYLHKGNVHIRSRNNKDFNKKFYPVYNALKAWPINAVIDGEIIVVNTRGVPDFGALQQWRSEADGELIYYVFDVLWLEGYDLGRVPLKQRRELLQQIIPGEGLVRLSENFAASGKEVYAQVEKMSLEGVLAKKADSVYTPDTRSKEWLKIKTAKQQDVIIAGYTRNENSKKKFSALLTSIYENGELVFTGPVGTGFTAKMQAEILEKLKPLETKQCPFAEEPEYNKPSRFRPNPPKAVVTWVQPKIVAEVSYRTVTEEGAMRHPSFKGLREDKDPKEVVREKAVPATAIVDRDDSAIRKKVIRPPRKDERKTLLNPGDETQVRKINGHDLRFTNLSKVFWPEEGITKRDMLNYYYQVVPYMLPYMKDRPQTLNRFPNGITGKSFYQKDVTGKVPAWIETYKYFSEGDQREKHFLVCSNEASLLYIASMGCIEMNPWSSRTQAPDNPDWCIIDLDPGKKSTFDHVIEAAQVTKQVLDTIGVPSYCKTSGSTGLHLYIPLDAKYDYEDSKEFARAVVKIVHAQLPAFTSIERKVNDRKGKMYLDFLQNRPQATVAGPYSLRPKPGAPVSMPLHWEEVKKGLAISDFTLQNAIDRLKSEGDLFKGVLGRGIDMNQAMTNMMKIFGRVRE